MMQRFKKRDVISIPPKTERNLIKYARRPCIRLCIGGNDDRLRFLSAFGGIEMTLFKNYILL